MAASGNKRARNGESKRVTKVDCFDHTTLQNVRPSVLEPTENEMWGTTSAEIVWGIEGDLLSRITSFSGGNCTVLSINKVGAPASGKPYWDLLFKVSREQDSAFFTFLHKLNCFLETAVEEAGPKLRNSQAMRTFSLSDEGESYIWSTRWYLNGARGATVSLYAPTGKKIQKGFDAIEKFTELQITKLMIPSIRLSSDKDEDDKWYARLTFRPLEMKVVREGGAQQKSSDKGSGKRKVAAVFSMADVGN
tara:strand:- start:363 stop:1109 length:747 start_codon:yes stop_codon:yes gene_type:complete